MARPVCVLSLFCLALLASQTEGKCSQFGHSCFGAHGKRSDTYQGAQIDEDPRFPLEEGPVDMYPSSGNQMVQEEIRFPMNEQQGGALSNPEIVANVRNWLGVLSRRLRRVPSRNAPSSPGVQEPAAFIQ